MAGTLVLVVEDNSKDSKLVGDVLRAKGYEIIHAATEVRGFNRTVGWAKGFDACEACVRS